MTRWARREARVWMAVAAAVVAHEALARALDRAGLVERLLAPSGAWIVPSVIAALAMYGLRLALLFVAPGWLLARALIAWRARRTH